MTEKEERRIAMKKTIACLMSILMLLTCVTPAFAEGKTDTGYTITNPYESVASLLGNPENHYKTNLHTHSTVSDGRVTMPEMIKEYYAQNFDILAMSEHGIIGKPWNEDPTHYYLMRICTFVNALSDSDDYYKRQYDILSDEEYKAITEGTYGFDPDGKYTLKSAVGFAEESSRTYGRGMNCMTSGIELSAASIMQNHVNGYFSDWGECVSGLLTQEGDYEYFISNVDKAGGVTVINHPGHYLNSGSIEENARDRNQLFYFSGLLNKYESCLGIETFNNRDTESSNNRVFWDELLQYVIPYGKRNVFGFSNSDAHDLNRIDTEFMDFVLPSYSMDNMRSAMENGSFFATGRLANKDGELERDTERNGPVPQITSINVDDENDIITVTAKNAKRIEWVANGKVIETKVTGKDNGETESVIRLKDHADDITCYVRFQVFGDGGHCYSNPFICDDGNMSRFIIEDDRSNAEIALDKAKRLLTENILGALFQVLSWAIEKEVR